MLALWLACTGSPVDSVVPFDFAPFEGLSAAPDPLADRLCPDWADPEAAEDRVFIDCALDTLETLVIDLVLGHGVTFSEPGLCAEPGCGDLSDHRAVRASVALD